MIKIILENDGGYRELSELQFPLEVWASVVYFPDYTRVSSTEMVAATNIPLPRQNYIFTGGFSVKGDCHD